MDTEMVMTTIQKNLAGVEATVYYLTCILTVRLFIHCGLEMDTATLMTIIQNNESGLEMTVSGSTVLIMTVRRLKIYGVLEMVASMVVYIIQKIVTGTKDTVSSQ